MAEDHSVVAKAMESNDQFEHEEKGNTDVSCYNQKMLVHSFEKNDVIEMPELNTTVTARKFYTLDSVF